MSYKTSIQAALAIAACSLMARSAATAPMIYNLGALGGTTSSASGINAAGQVVGSSETASGEIHAFLYTGVPGAGGVMADLGTLGGTSSRAFGVNAAGQVVGYSQTSSGIDRAFLYTGTPGAGGAMADLGALVGPFGYSRAYGINDAGQVAGESSIVGSIRAFLYTGAMADLGLLPGTSLGNFSAAHGINAAGQVVGHSEGQGPGGILPRAFLYTGTPGAGGAMAYLGTLGGSSYARAVNAAGQVAGWSEKISEFYEPHAFLYSGTPGAGGAMADLGTLGGMRSLAHGINVAGQVVGESTTTTTGSERHAFLYTGAPGAGGAMVDLDAWLDAQNPLEGAKWTLTSAYGLNDSGWIVGEGDYDDGPGGFSDGTRAFLLDARTVPEPSSMLVLAIGALALLCRRARFRT